MKSFHSVDEYLSALPQTARAGLESLRKTICQAAPQAEEVIHYNMPAFQWNGILVWYAAFKGHIGFYPRASAMAAFKDELTKYKTSKGAIQFPMEKTIPAGLVKRIVRFRVKENKQWGTTALKGTSQPERIKGTGKRDRDQSTQVVLRRGRPPLTKSR